MPLLTSPIDGSPMRQVRRFGIELDVCPTSGGVWLDRGELEKLIQFIQESDDDEQTQHAGNERATPVSRHHPNRQHHPQRKSGVSKLMDLFDF